MINSGWILQHTKACFSKIGVKFRQTLSRDNYKSLRSSFSPLNSQKCLLPNYLKLSFQWPAHFQTVKSNSVLRTGYRTLPSSKHYHNLGSGIFARRAGIHFSSFLQVQQKEQSLLQNNKVRTKLGCDYSRFFYEWTLTITKDLSKTTDHLLQPYCKDLTVWGKMWYFYSFWTQCTKFLSMC